MFRKLFSKATSPPAPVRGDLATDSGMLCLWDAGTFSHIHDYDSWESELCEDADILRHIAAGHFVPLNTGGDGAFAVEVRQTSPDSMNPREREYLLVPSQPYLLRCTGKAFVSGLEHVGANPGSCLALDLEPADYTVHLKLIDWAEEPGATDAQGNPSANALPDMIVFIERATDNRPNYRKELDTFRREDALR
jgi:hypothetical protein